VIGGAELVAGQITHLCRPAKGIGGRRPGIAEIQLSADLELLDVWHASILIRRLQSVIHRYKNNQKIAQFILHDAGSWRRLGAEATGQAFPRAVGLSAYFNF
jgi:hypothetical protein